MLVPRVLRHALPLLALAALSPAACDSAETAAADVVAAAPQGVSGEVTLGIDGAVVFDTGTVDPTGHHLTADLIAYKSGAGMDLKSGVPNGTTSHQPLRLFKTAGGKPATYASLDEVPREVPAADEANTYVPKAAAGMGFVVQNNISSGYTAVWVKSVDDNPTTVTIAYETFEP